MGFENEEAFIAAALKIEGEGTWKNDLSNELTSKMGEGAVDLKVLDSEMECPEGDEKCAKVQEDIDERMTTSTTTSQAPETTTTTSQAPETTTTTTEEDLTYSRNYKSPTLNYVVAKENPDGNLPLPSPFTTLLHSFYHPPPPPPFTLHLLPPPSTLFTTLLHPSLFATPLHKT